MLHIAFNYHDPIIQLRLGALLAMMTIIACLGVFEFTRNLGLRFKVLYGSILFIGCMMVAYALIQLKQRGM